MARFEYELPNDIYKELQKLEHESDALFGEMTQAAAKVVYNNIKMQVPKSWISSDIMRCLQITKVYKTPTDDGINTKVAFYGYFISKDGRRKPAPLICNVTEYGRSTDYPKHPFMRKSFRKSEIDSAMKKVEEVYFRGFK